ncbi:hypothetical protein WJX84_005389 [Apatococcus fuscideae]|uniref:Uncharacterized protein n=1 Tax=Apatococcus fuscideae TaxID=2026836 RepID=A0AAW1SNE0_9CHLO
MLTVAQNEADVNRYVEQYLYQPLEGASPLPGFMEHSFKMQCEKSDIFGQPDFVATAFNSAGQQQLLLAAESKTKMSFSVPDGSSTADAWQDPLLRKSIRGVEQVFGYMLQNGLHYSLLTTGELFVFMQRQGKSLQIADVHRVYEHLHEEQGVAIPRFVAQGHIIDSTFYFIATELMGPSLEFAVAGEEDLEPAAMRALERVHACGVLHGYTPWQEL